MATCAFSGCTMPPEIATYCLTHFKEQELSNPARTRLSIEVPRTLSVHSMDGTDKIITSIGNNNKGTKTAFEVFRQLDHQTHLAVETEKCLATDCPRDSVRDKFCLRHFFQYSVVLRSPATLTSESVKSPTNQESKQSPSQKAINELLMTEQTFVKGLYVVTNTFSFRLKTAIELNKAIIAEDEILKIFGNIDEIYKLQKRLLDDLEKHNADGSLCTSFAKTMLTYTPFLKMYTTYVNGYEEGVALLTELRKKKNSLLSFLK